MSLSLCLLRTSAHTHTLPHFLSNTHKLVSTLSILTPLSFTIPLIFSSLFPWMRTLREWPAQQLIFMNVALTGKIYNTVALRYSGNDPILGEKCQIMFLFIISMQQQDIWPGSLCSLNTDKVWEKWIKSCSWKGSWREYTTSLPQNAQNETNVWTILDIVINNHDSTVTPVLFFSYTLASVLNVYLATCMVISPIIIHILL